MAGLNDRRGHGKQHATSPLLLPSAESLPRLSSALLASRMVLRDRAESRDLLFLRGPHSPRAGHFERM